MLRRSAVGSRGRYRFTVRRCSRALRPRHGGHRAAGLRPGKSTSGDAPCRRAADRAHAAHPRVGHRAAAAHARVCGGRASTHRDGMAIEGDGRSIVALLSTCWPTTPTCCAVAVRSALPDRLIGEGRSPARGSRWLGPHLVHISHDSSPMPQPQLASRSVDHVAPAGWWAAHAAVERLIARPAASRPWPAG